MSAQLRRSLCVLVVCALSLCSQNPPPPAPVSEPKRLALLLGNGDYRHLPALPDVEVELGLMKGALNRADFDVTVERNFTLEKLSGIIASFLRKIQPGDVCFFYYSGYATQAQQENYLLPVEFDPATADPEDLSSFAKPLIGIQQILDTTEAGLKMLALEASRNNSNLMKRGIGLGLANPDKSSSREILFAFSAYPNQWSPDNTGIFTKYLAAAIDKTGLGLDEVFRDVFKQADAATDHKVQTYYLPFWTKDFYFHKPPPPPPAPKETLVTNHKDREDYVWVPPGTFKMGCVPGDPKCVKPEEYPRHTVTISKGFWMGRNEVQTGSYKRYVADDKTKKLKMPKEAPAWDTKWKLDSYPVVELTADEAQSYCQWAGGRLPTEAEWEYAARAGTDNQVNPLPEGKASRDTANFSGQAGNDRWDQAAPVRSFDPNAFGLFDMAGNVWEWCQDLFDKKYYETSPAIDPQGPRGLSGNNPHVVRGGGWNSAADQHLRLSYREGKRVSNEVGFRCVLPDTPDTTALFKPR